ncbi:RNA methyltransferase [Staphylococcus simulans]|uniref:RNA methyltransferase n=1 Tax=Staphylococcus simulans UMC-CNS-990 TaxID=1405498 RepID=A0ABN0PB58_STASI|nr:RNA methyltransferase [Staphylococcus simulans]ERS92792.1 RNA methyltransferase [Staphylococcus simulans UMC-CNS-990]MCE5148326.1 RNA methyltransferase [Staphylococcus simulans]PTJ34151.1 RNA methyltransferase [Staphylococcus simulans]
MEQITSPQNTKVKQANKLKKKKERDKTGLLLVEGTHLIEEAVQSQLSVKQLFVVEPERFDAQLIEAAEEAFHINFKVAESLSGTVTPQGIFAVIEKPEVASHIAEAKQVLLLDRIQDPGNLGTLIRTADAAALDLIVLSPGTADAYQDKVLRSSQGSVFHLPIVTQPIEEFINQFDGPVYGTALEDAVNFNEEDAQSSFALLLGNEGQGVDSALLSHTTKRLTIPMYGAAESLNVAIAGSILIYKLKG